MMLRIYSCVSLLTFAPACGFGFGSAYVGQWRAQEVVELEACVEDELGRCGPPVQVTSHRPERSFWGFTLAFPAVGASFGSVDGQSSDAFRLEVPVELLGGGGRLAAGLRVSQVLDLGAVTVTAVPIMGVAHLGLSARFSTYAAVGWSPFTLARSDELDLDVTSHTVGRLLVGLQTVLIRSQSDNRILWTIEVDRMEALGGSSFRSWGVTTHIGLSI